MGIRIGRFCPGKMASSHTGTGTWSLEIGKKYLKSKMGMGFENCEVGFGKKNELGNGIGTSHSLQDPLYLMY